jgi:hypothetical protein
MIDTDGPSFSNEQRIWQPYDRRRYAVLFYALLLTLIVTPLASPLGIPKTIIRGLCGIVLIAAVMPNHIRVNRYVLLAIISSIVIVGLASERDDVPIFEGSMIGVSGGIGLLAAAAALRSVVKAKTVDSEIVHAALSAYLLAGIFFAQLHLSIESYWPGSYTGPTKFTDASAVYFSFVTLATLGYGDFLPKSDLARGVTVFEVIGGQLYLAVMVARLIGLFPTSKQS